MSRQGALFGGGTDAGRYRVVDTDWQGVVLRFPTGRAVRVQGRNAEGEVVVHDCDQGGRDLRPFVVGVLPEDHWFVARKRRALDARRSAG